MISVTIPLPTEFLVVTASPLNDAKSSHKLNVPVDYLVPFVQWMDDVRAEVIEQFRLKIPGE